MTRKPPRILVGAAVFGAVFAGTVSAAAPRAGSIATVGGSGVKGTSGDGGPAGRAQLNHPRGLAWAPGGGFFVVEAFGNVVRRVAADGTITTVAGTRGDDFRGDGGPATQATIWLPHAVSPLTSGGYVIADTSNSRIRRVSPSGVISTVAGVANHGYNGDGRPATTAQLETPRDVAATPDGGFLIADSGNHRIRKVDPAGMITTVAGTGTAGYSGDGGAATSAQFSTPFAVAPLADGGFLVADVGNHVIRRVWPTGVVTTVAGTGAPGFAGDGGPATAARLYSPHNVTAARDGGFLIADTSNHRIRRVAPDGTITTVAGSGAAGSAGDGGSAVKAALNSPKDVLETPAGGLLIADAENNRVLYVGSAGQPTLTRLTVSPTRRVVQAPVGAGRASVRLSLWATLQIRIERGGRAVAAATVPGRPGVNVVRLPRVGAGVYAVTVTAASLDRQRASARFTLRVRR